MSCLFLIVKPQESFGQRSLRLLLSICRDKFETHSEVWYTFEIECLSRSQARCMRCINHWIHASITARWAFEDLLFFIYYDTMRVNISWQRTCCSGCERAHSSSTLIWRNFLSKELYRHLLYTLLHWGEWAASAHFDRDCGHTYFSYTVRGLWVPWKKENMSTYEHHELGRVNIFQVITWKSL